MNNDPKLYSNISGAFGLSLGSGTDRGYDVAIDSKGRVVMTGYSWDREEDDVIKTLRFKKTGELDGSFGNNGVVTTSVFNSDNPNNDESFQEAGDDRAYSIIVDNNDKIIVVGIGIAEKVNPPPLPVSNEEHLIVIRYNEDGTLDGGFGNKGIFTKPMQTGQTIP